MSLHNSVTGHWLDKSSLELREWVKQKEQHMLLLGNQTADVKLEKFPRRCGGTVLLTSHLPGALGHLPLFTENTHVRKTGPGWASKSGRREFELYQS